MTMSKGDRTLREPFGSRSTSKRSSFVVFLRSSDDVVLIDRLASERSRSGNAAPQHVARTA